VAKKKEENSLGHETTQYSWKNRMEKTISPAKKQPQRVSSTCRKLSRPKIWVGDCLSEGVGRRANVIHRKKRREGNKSSLLSSVDKGKLKLPASPSMRKEKEPGRGKADDPQKIN